MNGPACGASGYSVLGLDPFSIEFLSDPYPFHKELRDAGPIVWLDRYQCWAMGLGETLLCRRQIGPSAMVK